MKPSPTHQQESLMVALRVRPLNTAESKAGAKQIAFAVDKNLVVLMDPNDDSDDILRANRSREKKYMFDHVFDQHATQQDIYDSTVKAKNIVNRILNGFNCTVFAYGATGTGKTHTMLGTVKEPGIMILTLNDLYKKIEETKHEKIYKVSMAYIEIYNEMVRDLLKENPSEQVLDLREDSKGEIIISGLLDLEAHSTSDIMNLLSQGNQRRTSEPTAANKTSSRSHALLKLSIEQRNRAMNVKQEVKHGVLFMVDLAGSERAAVTQNRGIRMIEGAHINRSLLALANCINALTSNHHHHFVNYRDSKLTRLLKEALGGNCMTMMIAHISPASTVFEESRNTLVYAERGKRIKNKVRQNIIDVNYHVTQYQHIIDTLNTRVKYLQRELEQHLSNPQDPAITRLCEELKTLSQSEKETRQEILTLEYHLLQNTVECQKHLVSIREWEQQHLSIATLPTSLSSLELPSPTAAPESSNKGSQSRSLGYSSQTDDTLTEEHFSDAYVTSSDSPSQSRSSNDRSGSSCSVPLLETKVLKPKSKLFLPEFNSVMDEQLPTSSSGTCTEVVPADLEPIWVSRAREEVATLEADIQRMEAHHSLLQERLRENSAKMTTTKEKISALPEIHPIHKELIDLLCRTCETESTAVEHSLAASLLSVQLGHHESLIDRLLAHSSSLMKMITRLQTTLREVGGTIPVDVSSQSIELMDRQRELKAQVLVEKQIPLLSKKMQIPHLAKLSAQLYTTVTGSKSSLIADFEGKEDVEHEISLSNLPFLSSQPSIQSPLLGSFPSLSTTTIATVSQVMPSFLQLSSGNSLVTEKKEPILPPLDLSKLSLVTNTSTSTQETRPPIDAAKPLADTFLARIIEAAKAKKNEAHPTTLLSTNKPAKKALGSVTSLTTRPISQRIKSKSKYMVPKSVSYANSNAEDDLSKKSAVKKSMRRTIPMDRLVAVMKSRRKSVLKRTESFKAPKPSKQTLKPIEKRLPLFPNSTTKKMSSGSVDSLSLLQSNKKLNRLTRVTRTKHAETKKKEQLLSSFKEFTSSNLTGSPYQSPLRAVVHKGTPKQSHLDKGQQLKRSQAWK